MNEAKSERFSVVRNVGHGSKSLCALLGKVVQLDLCDGLECEAYTVHPAEVAWTVQAPEGFVFALVPISTGSSSAVVVVDVRQVAVSVEAGATAVSAPVVRVDVNA